MNGNGTEDLGKLIVRVALGVIVLLHGVAKLIGGIGGIGQMLQGLGLPGWFAYAVLIGEVAGPVLLIAGWHARLGAALIAVNMIVAIALVHAGEVFALNNQGGWAIELQGLLLFTAIGLVLTGPGRIGINKR